MYIRLTQKLSNRCFKQNRTNFDLSSTQAYGRDLLEAQQWCTKYQRSGNVKDLTQAWDLYYHVFRRISKQLPQVNLSIPYRHLLGGSAAGTEIKWVV